MATGKNIETHQNVSGDGKLFAPNIQSDHISGPVSVSMDNKTIVNYYGGVPGKPLTEADLQNLKEIHKNKSRDWFQYMVEYGKKGGSSVPLCQRFVKVSIVEVDMNESDRPDEASQNFIELDRLFEPSADQPKAPMTVVTRGIAGIGKSVLVQKLICDWATGAALCKYDFIFRFSFRELSLLSTVKKEISLPDLVKQHYPHIENCESILANESIQSMFIIDGLSDGELELDFNKCMVCRDVNMAVTPATLLINLIKGQLVPSATIWITTRAGTQNAIPESFITRMTEIKGFQDPEKEAYFRMRCKDDQLVERIIQVVKKQRSLFFMCLVPAFCCTLFAVLEAVLKSAGMDEIPQTLTEVYSQFLVYLIIYQQGKNEQAKGSERTKILQSKQNSVFALGKLAFEKSSKDATQTVLFSQKDLEDNGIDIAFVCGGLCKEIAGENEQTNYSFVHLVVQEYFAALYVFLSYHNHKKNAFGKKLKLYEKLSYSLICKEACKSAVKKGCQEFFLRFLCGLGTQKSQEFLRGLVAVDTAKDDSPKLAKFLKKTLQKRIPPEQTINILHCLNELNDISALDDIKAAFKTGTFKSGSLSPAQCAALAFALQMSEENYQELDLSIYKLPSIGIQRLLLIANYFSGIKLSGANIKDTGMKILSGVMKRQDCKLQSLKLDGNNLTHKSCEQLVEVLPTNQSITFLDLSDNNIQDKGVSLLCDALTKENCTLQILRVCNNKLTASCSEQLASMINTNKTLTELDISFNRIGEEGLKRLCEALKNEECKLEKLGLNSIFAFEFGIMGTYEDAPGAENLYDLLQDKNCTLQSLGLAKNSYTVESCKQLISALKENQSLKELDLSSNSLQNEGMIALCEILSGPGCKLHSLKVVCTKLTSDCCAELSSVFKTNQTLMELDLSMNELGDNGLNIFFNNLAGCKLQKLGLSKVGLTDAFNNVKSFSTLQTLLHLDLSYNKFTDKSIQWFQDFISDCKTLTTIRVEKNRFSADGYKKLQELEKKRNDLHVRVSKVEKI
ncbi:NACHT, LRR and PYD domains-containing protein 3-like [Hemitrygon akajei]|uniref:NACHT, LRR and PYD domains-containing protein 3-like n=1 Tax=Hemitrygon akajei TaxID=2704970 RepID=UPI003BF99496